MMSDRFYQQDLARENDEKIKDQGQVGMMAKVIHSSGLTRQEQLAFLVAAIMTIGPLFAAFWGRM